MSWPQMEVTLLDLRGTVGFALNWLLQSTLLISAGLVIARLISRRGSAAQSVVYCTTLAAVLVCPPLTWAISTAGIYGWSIQMPRTWTTPITGRPTSSPDNILPRISRLEARTKLHLAQPHDGVQPAALQPIADELESGDRAILRKGPFLQQTTRQM